MNENRRKFMRINASSVDCVVKLGVGESPGVLINESIDGLRIGEMELLILIADQKVTVCHDDGVTVGRCRSVSRNPNGTFQIGIYRVPDNYVGDATSILLNSFMRFDGCDVVCVPLAVMDDNRLRIRLINGVEFTVRREQLFQLTREEREQELRNPGKLQKLIEVYSFMDNSRDWYGADDVVNHEFGPPVQALARGR